MDSRTNPKIIRDVAMKIHTEFQQGSALWMQARAGIPTASEFDQLVSPEWKARTGQMPRSYLATKLAEWWIGGPLLGFNSFATEQGQILEDEAKPWYCLEYGEAVTSVGLCTTDDGMIGCSPDGLLGADGGLEIKCPSIETHVGYLLDGGLPKEYRAQVQGGLFVTGRPWWRFVSYRRQLPALVLTIERDEEAQSALRTALAEFLVRLQSGKQRLIELNGGPPKRVVQANTVGESEMRRRALEQVEDIIP